MNTNHLQEAKRNMQEVIDLVGANSTELNFITAHALIAIAEGQSKQTAELCIIHSSLDKIAEQLEKMSGGAQANQSILREGILKIFNICEEEDESCTDNKFLNDMVTRVHEQADELLQEFPDKEDK